MVPEVRRKPGSISLVVACIGLAALAAWCIASIIERSARPGMYYQYRNSAEGFVYPAHEVIWWSGAIVVELGLALAVLALARRTSTGVRLLTVGVLFGFGFCSMIPFVMHSPPYFGGHLGWLFLAAAWSIVTAIAAAIEKRVRA